MHHGSDKDLPSKKSSKITVSSSLERLRVTLDLSHEKWAEMLGVTKKDYDQICSSKKEPSALTIMNLAEKLGLNFESIIQNKIDYAAVAARMSGNQNYIPEHFMVGALSKRRTSINVLDYVEDFHGWRTKLRLLREFNMSEAAFSNPDELISIQFLMNICEHLIQNGHSPNELYAMGSYSVITNQNSPIGQKLRSIVDLAEIYEVTFTDLSPNYYDRNFNYRLLNLDWTNGRCSVEAAPSEEGKDALKTHRVGSKYLCMLRAGTFSSLVGYQYLPFSVVDEVSCIHRGDSACIYEIGFERALHLKSQGHSHTTH